jgi:hypothetical protein
MIAATTSRATLIPDARERMTASTLAVPYAAHGAHPGTVPLLRSLLV